jgi:uncharacterized membrane protein
MPTTDTEPKKKSNLNKIALGLFLFIIIGLISLNIAATQVGRKCFESTKEGDGKTNYEYLGVVSTINIFGLIFVILFSIIGVVIATNVSGANTLARASALNNAVTTYKTDSAAGLMPASTSDKV